MKDFDPVNSQQIVATDVQRSRLKYAFYGSLLLCAGVILIASSLQMPRNAHFSAIQSRVAWKSEKYSLRHPVGEENSSNLIPLSSTTVAAAVTSITSNQIDFSKINDFVKEINKSGGKFCDAKRKNASKIEETKLTTSILFYLQPPMQQVPSTSVDTFDDAWVKEICPEVVQHFERVRYFEQFSLTRWPITLTTREARVSVCMLKIMQLNLQKVSIEMFLFAGSHLGAIQHAGPIPWDDDMDIIINVKDRDKAIKVLKEIKLAGKTFRYQRLPNVQGDKFTIDDSSFFDTGYSFHWPYIDVFYYDIADGKLHELDNKIVKIVKNRYSVDYESIFKPLREYRFGGLKIRGPSVLSAQKRYSRDPLTTCVSAGYNHRYEDHANAKLSTLNCCILSQYLPFVHRLKVSNTTEYELLVYKQQLIHTSLVQSGQLVEAIYQTAVR